MRRSTVAPIVALAALAASTIALLAPQGALAALPEFRTCVKASPKNTGQFSDRLCSQPSTGTGRYELGAWDEGRRRTFTGRIEAPALHSYIPEDKLTPWTGGMGVSTAQCKAGNVAGELTGAKTSTLTIELRACVSEGKRCSSPGARVGVIETSQLTATLGYILGGVGVEVEASDHGAYAEFACNGLSAVTRGSQVGVVTGNVNEISTTGVETFAMNALGGPEVVFGEFPEDPETGLAHYLRSTIAPLDVSLPTSGSVTAVLKGAPLEVQA